jgi:hypothetical protein
LKPMAESGGGGNKEQERRKGNDEGDRNAQLLGQGHGCSESLCRDGRVMAVNRQVQPQAGVAVFSFLWHV